MRPRSIVLTLALAVTLAFAVYLPALGAAAAEPLRFSFVSDNHGDSGFPSILQQIAKLPGGPGAFMLLGGDISPVATTRSHLETAFGKSFLWYSAVGNHETSPPGDIDEVKTLRDYFNERLKDKVTPGPQGTAQTTYSFDAGDVHIAVINLYWNGKAGAGSDTCTLAEFAQPLRRWLRRDLEASHKPWKIVMGHEPVYPQPDQHWGTIRHAVGALQTLSPFACKDFWSILDETGVAAYLCGHTHMYSRYQPAGSHVWQINTAQARNDKKWQNDAFVIVTADPQSLKFETYRNLKVRSQFEVVDTLTLKPADVQPKAPAAAAATLEPAK